MTALRIDGLAAVDRAILDELDAVYGEGSVLGGDLAHLCGVPPKWTLSPAAWVSDWEFDPVWQFVHRSHPDAIPVWVCGEKGDDPPQNPPAHRPPSGTSGGEG